MTGNTCYILGAGASYGYNSDLDWSDWPPLTDELIKRGAELDIISHDDFYDLRHALKRYAEQHYSEGSIDMVDWEYDLEKALNWIVTVRDRAFDWIRENDSPVSDQDCRDAMDWTGKALSQSYYFLYELLRQYTINSTVGSDAYTQLGSHYRDSEFSVITLNYDMIFERALAELGLHYHHIPEQAQDDSVPIAKLHGSINWMNENVIRSDAAIQRRQFREIITPIAGIKAHTGNVADLSFDELESTPYHRLVVPGPDVLEPGLVPPIGLKEKIDKIDRYHEVWDYAGELIENASQFVIIGCSLRSDDKAFRGLLSDHSGQEPEITVVKHSPDEITDDINEIFDDPTFNEPYPSFERYTDDL